MTDDQRYAVHALLGINQGGFTEEASREAESLDKALALAREVAEAVPTFRAITILHAEDLPLTLQGARDVASRRPAADTVAEAESL